jgi:hypothetical protein
MEGSPNPANRYGIALRGITQSDVSHAADSLLRAGERPTNDKVRAKIGKGSPNTINPMLDAWWKTLSLRLDSGPAALHRLPESVAHIAEALWMQALEEGRRRALIEQRDSTRLAELDKQRLELRSHTLTLREGELDSRLRDRDRRITELELSLKESRLKHAQEQATVESLKRQLRLADQDAARRQKRRSLPKFRARVEQPAARQVPPKTTKNKRRASTLASRRRRR